MIPALLALAAIQAQAASQPPRDIPAPLYGQPITLAQAKTMMTAAEGAARAGGFAGAVIAITQPDGTLVLFEKMDESTYVSVDFAIAKARTAATSRRATGPGPGGGAAPLPTLITLAGGFPIIAGGRTIGGIGVSGTEGGDGKIAQAALAAVQ